MMLQTFKAILLSVLLFFVIAVDAKQLRGLAKNGSNKRSSSSAKPSASSNQPTGLCGRRQLMGSKQDNFYKEAATVAVVLDIVSFTSEFYVAYGGPTGAFVGTDVMTVENAVKMTYNDVVGCSQELVLDTVMIAEQLYYPPDGGRRALASTSYTLVNRYSVSGRCRLCSSGTKLFNDAVRRRLQVAEFNSAALINLNSAGIVSVTSVSASNALPLDPAETQLLGDIDALVEGIVESQPAVSLTASGGSV